MAANAATEFPAHSRHLPRRAFKGAGLPPPWPPATLTLQALTRDRQEPHGGKPAKMRQRRGETADNGMEDTFAYSEERYRDTAKVSSTKEIERGP